MDSRMKRTILYVALGVVVVAVAAGAILMRSRGTARAEEAIRSTVVERGAMLVAVSASGSIEPQARVALAQQMLDLMPARIVPNDVATRHQEDTAVGIGGQRAGKFQARR